MNAEELRSLIESQGYEVRSIRVFSKSFHVNYWTPDAKIIRWYKVPIETVEWNDVKHEYPKV